MPGCASKILKIDNSEQILENKEYDTVLEVTPIEGSEGTDESGEAGAYVLRDAPPYVPPPSMQMSKEAVAPSHAPSAPRLATPSPVVDKKDGKAGKKMGAVKSAPPAKVGTSSSPAPAAPPTGPKRQPELEDAAGFAGRRPIVDPFRVGESVTLEASYFSVVAGDITLEVRPFKAVNGRKSYHFAGIARSTSVFALFYAVDDLMETFVDYDDLIPYNYALHVKESRQLREVRSFFDWKALRGYVWDRKVTNDKGVKEQKYEWDILPYSQNVFSAPFYLRTFQLEPGKSVHYRIGHEGKNIVVTADVLRREKLSTPVGELDTLVVRPKIEIDGVFKPIGDVFFWLTDDDRKFIVRIEAKIRIGKVVAMVKSINKGQ